MCGAGVQRGPTWDCGAPPDSTLSPSTSTGSTLYCHRAHQAERALWPQAGPETTQDAGSSVRGARGLQASEGSLAPTAPCKYRAKNFLNVSGWKPVGPTGSWKEHSPLGSCYQAYWQQLKQRWFYVNPKHLHNNSFFLSQTKEGPWRAGTTETPEELAGRE